MLQALLQAEDEQHKGDGDDEGYGFGPLEDDLGCWHCHVLDVAVLGHVYGYRPIFFLDQFFDVGDTVRDDVVEHQRIQSCYLLLRTVGATERAQQHAITHHEEHQLKHETR